MDTLIFKLDKHSHIVANLTIIFPDKNQYDHVMTDYRNFPFNKFCLKQKLVRCRNVKINIDIKLKQLV